jgi:polar amino acid transport system substrate-binding protein
MKKVLLVFIIILFLFQIKNKSTSIMQDNFLRWGSETESGIPMSFRNPKNIKQIIGYEKDIVKSITKNKFKNQKQIENNWNTLVLGLKNQLYDIAINGIVVTSKRSKKINFSYPYLITHAQLFIYKKNNNINSIKNCKGKTIGVILNNASEQILRNNKINAQIITYESESIAFKDLISKRIDALFLDYPIGLYFSLMENNIKEIGPPIGKLYYAIALKKSNTKLLRVINKELQILKSNGELRKILEDWNLWNSMIANEWGESNNYLLKPKSFENVKSNFLLISNNRVLEKLVFYVELIPYFIYPSFVTLKITVFSMLLAMKLGLILTIIKIYNPFKLYSRFLFFLVEITRGTPIMIQLFFIFYGLPNIGIKVSSDFAGIFILGMNYAIYESEIYYSSFYSIPIGQIEAAFSLGMSRIQTFWHIIFPQIARIVILPITNDFITMLKDSSLISLLAVSELTLAYQEIAATYYDYFGFGIIISIIYFLLGIPFIKLSKYFSKNLKNFGKR